ncbi:AlpA family phage regulatory protein [uncultured Sphingomonas sp.]|uniref:AlpA family phage regulatory protein n=1 Tax=uncultured Sphingomonas sp. TaxID=158754 RepID=UPI0037498A25
MAQQERSNRILRRPEVGRIVGLGRSSIYRLMNEGVFPRPILIGRRAVGWTSSSIDDWLTSRPVSTGWR